MWRRCRTVKSQAPAQGFPHVELSFKSRWAPIPRLLRSLPGPSIFSEQPAPLYQGDYNPGEEKITQQQSSPNPMMKCPGGQGRCPREGHCLRVVAGYFSEQASEVILEGWVVSFPPEVTQQKRRSTGLPQDSLELLYSRKNYTEPKSGWLAAACITTPSPSTTFQAGHQFCTKAAQTLEPSGERNHGDFYGGCSNS